METAVSQDISANAKLTTNINLNSKAWTPIGNYSSSTSLTYKGTFDGGGYTIFGLYINNSSSDYQGLFGYIYNGTVQNVTVSGSVIGGNRVGGVAGNNNGTMTNCYNTCTVSGNTYVGGVVGVSSKMTNCSNSGTVTGTTTVGGVVGSGEEVGYCGNSGTVKGSEEVAGVIASVGSVYYCYNTGKIGGDTYVGGVAGNLYSTGMVSDCYNTGTVSGTTYVGSLVGYNGMSTVRYSYYLDTSASAAIGTNFITAYAYDNVSKTADEFVSGEVAYLLNDSTSGGTTWYQNLDNGKTVDESPVLDSSHGTVYVYTDCAGAAVYSNATQSSKIHVYGSNGICSCGEYQSATTNSSGVYEISNAGQLFWFAQKVNGGTTGANAVLTADIDLESIAWTPIANYYSNSRTYTGTFDGQGHTISGLYLYALGDAYQGLFGYIGSKGTVKNVTVSGSVSGYYYIGGIAGYNAGTISGCVNQAATTSKQTAGGIVGFNDGMITSCGNTGSVTGLKDPPYGNWCFLGGIVGSNDEGLVSNCWNSGKISGGENFTTTAAGIAGHNYAGTLSNCYNIGTISRGSSNEAYLSGIAGPDYTGTSTGTVINCYYLSGTQSDSTSTSKTAAQFASGEVAYLLNGSVSGGTNFYQNLDNGETVDSYPLPISTHGTVYYGYESCSSSTCIYSNTKLNSSQGHSYTVSSFSWASDYSTCTAEMVCSICGDTASETCEVTSEVTTKATCTENGIKTYTATVELNGKTYSDEKTEDIPKIDHTYGDDGFCTNCGAYQPAEQKDGVYQISNAGNLYWFAALVNGDTSQEDITEAVSDADAVLTCDLDLKDYTGYIPIGYTAMDYTSSTFDFTGYAGTFDGQGHTISNLTISNDDVSAIETVGLFGTLSGTVQNLGMESFTFHRNKGSDGRFGAIVGQMITGSTVKNCYVVNSTVDGDTRISGAIAGCNYAGTVENCFSYNCTVEATTRAGDLVGDNQNDSATLKGSIVNCYCDDTLVGIASNSQTGTVTGGESGVSAERFTSGEVAYLLQNGQSTQVWGQNLTSEPTDTYPVLSSDEAKKVIKITFTSVDDDTTFETRYTNANAALASGEYPTSETDTYVFYSDEACTTKVTEDTTYSEDTTVYVKAAVILGGSSNEATKVIAASVTGSGTSTLYVGVSADDISNFSTGNYPTTALTFTADDGETHGYIFAGWYSSADNSSALESFPTDDAYAKFVDEDVLSVVCYFTPSTVSTSGKGNVWRLITSWDKAYSTAGFTVYYDEACTSVFEDAVTTTTYYSKSYSVGGTSSSPALTLTPSDFSEASTYVATGRFYDASLNSEFTIKAYWKTPDGTTVYGNAFTFNCNDVTNASVLTHVEAD